MWNKTYYNICVSCKCRCCWFRSRWVSGWQRWPDTTSQRDHIRMHTWIVRYRLVFIQIQAIYLPLIVGLIFQHCHSFIDFQMKNLASMAHVFSTYLFTFCPYQNNESFCCISSPLMFLSPIFTVLLTPVCSAPIQSWEKFHLRQVAFIWLVWIISWLCLHTSHGTNLKIKH